MTTFAIEQRPQQYVFEAPRWADVLAKAWLILVTCLVWVSVNQPKAEVYLLSRFDLARRYIGPIPPATFRLDYALAGTMLVVLWQEFIVTGAVLWQELLISGSVKAWGSVCLG